MKVDLEESKPQNHRNNFVFYELDELPVAQPSQTSERCQVCDQPVFRSGGCPVCMHCGWSACG